LVAGSVSSPAYYYVHTGQIGEPLIVTDASKAKVWDAAVDPWGKPTMLATPTQTISLRLPGQWYASESGLHQNWMRDYDPSTGRYIEADLLGIDAGANLYPYIDGNPLNASDPTGHIALAVPAFCAVNPEVCVAAGLAAAAAIYHWINSIEAPPLPSTNIDIPNIPDKNCKNCPPCRTISGKVVSAGTIGYRFDMVPPSRPHHGVQGDH